ncbi:MAG TPA: KH domain-containing protein [Candidatus Saccharimonadales bacterium]
MNNSIDQQFVEFVVKSLVSKPEAVQVVRRIDEKGVLLELTVDPEDLGRVIGKRGATAQSLRTLLRALGTKNDARYNLKIIDNGVGGYSSDRQPSAPAASVDAAGSDNLVSDDTTAPAAPPQADDLDDTDTAADSKSEPESDVVAKTRKELEDLDDLDV